MRRMLRLCQAQHMQGLHKICGGKKTHVSNADWWVGRASLMPSKRPAAAVWGNGLWGSVGAAGRSYD